MDGGEKVGLGVKGTRSQADDGVVGMGSWKRSEQDKNARFWRGGEIPTLEHEFWLSAGQSSPEEHQKPKLKKEEFHQSYRAHNLFPLVPTRTKPKTLKIVNLN